MKYAFLFFLIVILLPLSGCGDDPNTNNCDGVVCEDNEVCNKDTGKCRKLPCSEEVPDGRCSSGKVCQAGVCVDLPCSEDNPFAECPAGQFCGVKGDITKCWDFDCSQQYPNGYCGDSQLCVDGECKDYTCSASKPDGTCPSGKECKDGKCEEFECSASHPNGTCPNGKICVSGECFNPNEICSAANPTGLCPEGEECVQGTCVQLPCSELNPSGYCPEGEYCNRSYNSETEEYEFVCKPFDCSEANPTGRCADGQICQAGICVADTCGGRCVEREICEFGQCKPDPFYCGPDSPNGWCPTGEYCTGGECKEIVINPCDDIICDIGKTCLVTNGEGVCYSTADLCSSTNLTGKCNDGFICDNGECKESSDKCIGVECEADELCDPQDGICYDNPCNGITCSDVNSLCTPKLNDPVYPNEYICLCKAGYIFDFIQQKCVFNEDACTNVDCGEGQCIVAGFGHFCQCNVGRENRRPENVQDKCINPATYNYCDDLWSCSPNGACVVKENEGYRYAECQCHDNYIYDVVERSCELGLYCGINVCNPLAEICREQTQQCVEQDCSAEFPQGNCGDTGVCDNGACVSGECSTYFRAGTCMDGYSCRGGLCEHTAGPKAVGESCDLTTNNCVSNAYCLASPEGTGVCYQLCDSSDMTTCTEAGSTCVSRGVFKDDDFQYIGVCAKDALCDLTTSNGCPLQEQVCLRFQNTALTQCLYTGTRPLGSACNPNVATQLCEPDLLCVSGICVPNCSRDITSVTVNFCYDAFKQGFNVENLNLPYFNTRKFRAFEALGTALCNPDVANTCTGGLTCNYVQDKTTNANSNKIGVCTSSCNPNSAAFRNECSGSKICYKSLTGNTGICLGEIDCNFSTSERCNGDETCYPVTNTLNACMFTADGMLHPGDTCNFTDLFCQYGQCVEGKCTTVCDKAEGFCPFGTQTCQNTTDSYYGNTSYFGSPVNYGVCK